MSGMKQLKIAVVAVTMLAMWPWGFDVSPLSPQTLRKFHQLRWREFPKLSAWLEVCPLRPQLDYSTGLELWTNDVWLRWYGRYPSNYALEESVGYFKEFQYQTQEISTTQLENSLCTCLFRKYIRFSIWKMWCFRAFPSLGMKYIRNQDVLFQWTLASSWNSASDPLSLLPQTHLTFGCEAFRNLQNVLI